MSLTGKSILIVDDEQDIRSMLRLDFELEGGTVYECSSAAAALEFIQRNPVDVVVSDFRMPQMNGYELLVQIREKNKTIPKVILITGFAECTREEAVNAGATELLSKPIDIPHLLRISAL